MNQNRPIPIKNLISVIVTTHNRSHYLGETLESIHNQTHRPIEIIVVDDGSSAEESQQNKIICSKFTSCQYFYKQNSGQPHSRNYGIKKAKGAYIGFCDDDDIWVLDKLEKQLKVFDRHSEIFIVTGDTASITHDGKETGAIKSHAGFNHGYIFKHLLLKNRTASIIPLLRREVFEKVGYFNTSFTIGEDWEFWRRVSYYYPFYAINEVLGYVRLHEHNMSLSRSDTPIERILLYRKLTQALLHWGEHRISIEDTLLIKQKEWAFYRRLISNNFSGVLNKLRFVVRLYLVNINVANRIILLALKFKLKK
ncbi:glycosyltransferase involved in cell wall biosynthesis [Flavobacteriaceae bacterium MAR_2010_105]|nr:glycosyltransferase involved in cell wall biosynthesis [Flavobacteriaceae bacterium MAR_2010_105]